MHRKFAATLCAALVSATGAIGLAQGATISYHGEGKLALRAWLATLGMAPDAVKPWKEKPAMPGFPNPLDSRAGHVEWLIKLAGQRVSANAKTMHFRIAKPQSGDTLEVSWSAPWRGHEWSARERLGYRAGTGWVITGVKLRRL